MHCFDLWYAYYDSLFLLHELKLPHHLISMCLFDNLREFDQRWPMKPCRQLSEIFILLESFIMDPNNWQKSNSNYEQLTRIEEQLSKLRYFLKIEKYYASLFWKKDERRVEASLTHFYSLIQLLIKSLIPFPAMSLIDTKQIRKLSFSFEGLENLFNSIFKKINPISLYFSSNQKFLQENKLIYNFFENMVCFLKKAPKIQKKKLNHIHSLAKYVCLANSIEICRSKMKLNDCSFGIRRKSNSLDVKRTNYYSLNLGDYPDKDEIREEEDNGCHVERMRSKSEKIRLPNFFGEEKNGKLEKFFNFPHFFYGNSNQVSETISTKSSVSSICFRRGSRTKSRIIRRSLFKQISNTMHKASQRELQTPTSSKIMHPSRVQFSGKKEQKKVGFYFYERFLDLTEEERYQNISNISTSNTVCARTLPKASLAQEIGVIKVGKGWKIVQNYFWERVRRRKIRKVINGQF